MGRYIVTYSYENLYSSIRETQIAKADNLCHQYKGTFSDLGNIKDKGRKGMALSYIYYAQNIVLTVKTLWETLTPIPTLQFSVSA